MSGTVSADPAVDLTTLSDVQAWLTALQLPTVASGQLQQMVSGMSDAIAGWLGYSPIQSNYDATFDGRDTPKVAFPNTPVTAVSSLTINGLEIPASTSPKSMGYVVTTNQRQSWLTLRGYKFWRGEANCSISYTAGYASGSLPPALVQACREAIAAMSQITGREPGLTKEKVGGLEEDYAPPSTSSGVLNSFVLTPTITMALMPLRRVVPAW